MLARADGYPGDGAPSDLLEVRAVSKHYGPIQALSDLSFTVRKGEILGVAGPNGAGKSTLLAVCTGHQKSDAGDVLVEGAVLSGRPPHRFCHAGVARMFQIPQVFSSLTVRQNVEVGATFGWRPGSGSRLSVEELMRVTGLDGLGDHSSADVDLITRKRIMLAAALATGPKVLFMDEPLAGLNEEEIETLAELIATLHRTLALSIVLVEHKVRALARLSDRIMILNFGRLVRLGPPAEILADPEIIDLYLGRSYVA
ncbi:ABC transporter ATP-binding protein [Chthonobacter albigriseus]|uniref:ABC transporter ATP-binding protein n=1 Tax=Chthonobacter albigriseus TaxID=1683161 RepID=UPI0015EFC591|nr:ATP-binding cassette domain-containing protein [Chthonobacter albigriseus]